MRLFSAARYCRLSCASLVAAIYLSCGTPHVSAAEKDAPAAAPSLEAKPADPKPEAAKTDEAKPAAKSEEAAKSDAPQPGHSLHGEVFNEGPRQKAYLMPGMPNIKFPVTTKSDEAQKFINQGVGQLHGFWYFEAERSFRQAAALDKECGMAYWGMAMANIDNATRARKFMKECLKHKTGLTERETMYIDALDAYFKAGDKKKKDRNEAYTRALEKILYKHPDDLDAKAFLALQLWKNRDSGLPISSYLAIDALLSEVFAANPMHPAHHYRIHLWDYEKADKALKSAALCGQSSPGIAHMWHMPGHIYSRLKRYDDACWQQEASARTDHAHMMRDRVLPDQIHNFAHNNEWLIRDMVFVGRIGDALDLAKNMCELPRHPKYNTLSKGSTNYGRQRLFEVLAKYELWPQMIALCNSPYLEPTDKEEEQVKRLRHLGMAYYRSGDAAHGDEQLAEVERRLAALKEEQSKAQAEAEKKATDEKKSDGDIKKAKRNAGRPFENRVKTLEKARDELQGHQAVAARDFPKGIELLKKAGGVDAGYLAELRLHAGQADDAIKDSRSNVSRHTNEVIPQAQLVDLLWRADKKDDAKKEFEKLRQMSGSIDLDAASPVFARLEPVVKELQLAADWRIAKPAKDDVGKRPPLDSLGPLRWSPSPAIEWRLKQADGTDRSLADYRGRPVVVIFFLGNGCLHCAEQLHAFGKAAADFEKAGLSLVAVSSDDQNGLKESIANYSGGPIPIPLVSDDTLATFKAYRCYDDFEQQPLHGTFLIDGEGKIRWQDISYEPFMDAKFVITEAQRLLGSTAANPVATTANQTQPAAGSE